jgi:signal peptidase I
MPPPAPTGAAGDDLTGARHDEPRSPAEECLVAVAGSLVTIAVIGLALGGAGLTHPNTAPHGVLVLLAAANLIMLCFHLLPGLPADGGRIVRAVGWWLSGSRDAGNRATATGGRLAIGLITVMTLATLSFDDLATAATALSVAGGLAGLLWLGSARALAEAGHPFPRGTPLPLALAIALGVVIALVLRTYVVQAFVVRSGSMERTLRAGDWVLVDKLGYRLPEVRHGDLVLFRRPPGLQLPKHGFVERVIGLPGDRIESRDGELLLNGSRLDEPYLRGSCGTGRLPALVVPAGRLYVLGDNRCDPADSRAFGTLDAGLIEGRALVVLWPLRRFGTL